MVLPPQKRWLCLMPCALAAPMWPAPAPDLAQDWWTPKGVHRQFAPGCVRPVGRAWVRGRPLAPTPGLPAGLLGSARPTWQPSPSPDPSPPAVPAQRHSAHRGPWRVCALGWWEQACLETRDSGQTRGLPLSRRCWMQLLPRPPRPGLLGSELRAGCSWTGSQHLSSRPSPALSQRLTDMPGHRGQGCLPRKWPE